MGVPFMWGRVEAATTLTRMGTKPTLIALIARIATDRWFLTSSLSFIN